MSQGLARVEELFEARAPKNPAVISELDWVVTINPTEKFNLVKVTSETLLEDEYYYWDDFALLVKEWQEVKEKQIIAKSNVDKQKIVSSNAWVVKKAANGVIVIKDTDKRVCEYEVEFGNTIIIKNGDYVTKGKKLTEGHVNLQRLMEVAWILKTQEYIVWEIKSIYASQWQTVNSKHIELIVRQMFSRVRILDKWDSEFFPWDIVDIIKLSNENNRLISEGKKTAIAERLLLWITKISLHTDSWLSAASFQETVRVLVEWAVSWKIDKLKELKENVIIWRLIPAWKQYRKINWIETDLDLEDELYFDAEETWHESFDYNVWVNVDDWNYNDFTIVWDDEEM